VRILLTRPSFDAARTAEKLSALGYEAVIDSVIEIEPQDFALPGGAFSAIAFTSANALRALSGKRLPALPCFAVGGRTAEVAREYGFADVRAAGGDVESLAALIAKEMRAGDRILHLAGEDRAGDLRALLSKDGILVETVVVYRAKASSSLGSPAIVLLRDGLIGAVLHYSERSASIFAQLAEAAHLRDKIRSLRHLCLSSAVARPLKSFGITPEIAARPDEDALLALLGAKLDKPPSAKETGS